MKSDENFSNISRYDAGRSNTGLIAGMAIVFVVVLVAGIIGFTVNQKKKNLAIGNLETQKTDLAIQLSQRDSVINEWVVAFNEIENDIAKITAREKMLNLNSKNPELSPNKKEEILKEIQYINTLIDQNKKKISSLNVKLKKSGIQMAGFQARIDTLTNYVAQRDKDITALKMELVDRSFEIGQMNEKMSAQDLALADKENQITEKTSELNKGYIASGTRRDLKEKGLVIKEGGVLGLGKKESLQENFENDSLFTRVNITETKTIPVNSKSAKLVTEHPLSSYALIKDENEDRIAYIEIKDPVAFWKISKYAVVEIGNN